MWHNHYVFSSSKKLLHAIQGCRFQHVFEKKRLFKCKGAADILGNITTHNAPETCDTQYKQSMYIVAAARRLDVYIISIVDYMSVDCRSAPKADMNKSET